MPHRGVYFYFLLILGYLLQDSSILFVSRCATWPLLQIIFPNIFGPTKGFMKMMKTFEKSFRVLQSNRKRKLGETRVGVNE